MSRIALVAKNDRAVGLFTELSSLSARYEMRGAPEVGFLTKVMGRSASAIRARSRDSQHAPFSAPYARSMTRLLGRAAEGADVVVAWGAMCRPVRTGDVRPYFIITDGPFDPDNDALPETWRPGPWATSYLERQRRIYREAAHVFTLSSWARDAVLRIHDIDDQHVTAIGWGPGATLDERIRVESKVEFLMIGSHWATKGFDRAAQLATLVSDLDPQSPARLIIAGDPMGCPGPPHHERLDVRAAGLSRGQVDDLMASARGFLLTSRYDASPHVVREAQLRGLPVVAFNVCGVADAVPPESHGVLLDAGDLRGMASEIVRLAALCEAEALQLHEATRVWARQHATWREPAAAVDRVVSKM